MSIQTNFTKYLNKTYQIVRYSKVKDATGGYTTSRTTIGTVSGRMSIKAGIREETIARNNESTTPQLLFLEASANVQRNDVIIDTADSTEWRVIQKLNPSRADHHLQVEVELQNPKNFL